MPNYRARGEQHYRVPYKEPNCADCGGRVDVGKINRAVNFEKELLHAKFLGLACRRKHMSKRSISVRALFPQYGKNMTKKT